MGRQARFDVGPTDDLDSLRFSALCSQPYWFHPQMPSCGEIVARMCTAVSFKASGKEYIHLSQQPLQKSHHILLAPTQITKIKGNLSHMCHSEVRHNIVSAEVHGLRGKFPEKNRVRWMNDKLENQEVPTAGYVTCLKSHRYEETKSGLKYKSSETKYSKHCAKLS